MPNPIKPTIKTEAAPLLIIIFSVVAAIYFYFNLPALVPVHWNFAGEVDRWGSGQTHAIFFPVLVVGMYLLFLLLPYLDPKKERYEQFGKVYHVFKAIIITFLAIIYFATGLSGLGYNLPIGVITPILVGVLFVVMGNYMGKIKMNWFVGIRTPWTLSSEEVWNKTHRFGGRAFILGGLIIMIEPIMPLAWRLPAFIAAISVILIGTLFYSYLIFRQEKKHDHDKQLGQS